MKSEHLSMMGAWAVTFGTARWGLGGSLYQM